MLAKKQLKGKNQPRIPIQEMSFMLNGTDVSAIKGVGVNTVLTILSEVGQSIKKFKNRKAFVSWLRLAPNNKLSGGKILSSRTPKGNTPLSIALRDAASVIGNQKSGELTDYFKSISFKHGRCVAITATARKLATIIYNMIIKSEPYDEAKNDQIKEKVATRRLNKAINLIKRKGFYIIDNQSVMMS